ncbi:MAG: hypothetical protein L0Y48_01775 [Fusobacteria bacterium]|nr:hypothetical protein [Fusobacteriota bacterium]
MKEKKKLLLGVAFALLLIVASVSLTVAYFTQTTAEKINVFTLGTVSATLTEPNFEALTAEQKVLVPSRIIPKDPTVTIGANSEEVYARVFVKIETDFLNAIDTTAGFTTPNSGWSLFGTTVSGDYTIIEYRFSTIVGKATTDQELPQVFEQLKIKNSATTTDISAINDPNIKVIAQIVQVESFADATAAFTAVGRPAGY